MLIVLFLVSHFNFLFVPCGGLSWLPVSFLLHVKYTLSYRIVYSIFIRMTLLEFCHIIIWLQKNDRASDKMVDYVFIRFQCDRRPGKRIPYIVERIKIIMTNKYDQWFYYRIVATVTFAIYMNALIRVVGDLWKLRSEDS